jgi:hypothetical protein
MTTKQAAVPVKEKAHTKYAWVLLFIVSAFFVFRDLNPMLSGGAFFDSRLRTLTGMGWNQIATQNPAIATFINGTQYEGEVFILCFGLFSMAVSALGYRRGNRSSWYAAWIILIAILFLLPLDFGANTPFATVGPPPGLTVEEGAAGIGSGFMQITVALAILTLLGLLLPYRKFFPKGK